MATSSTHGTPPLINSKLADYLSSEDDTPVYVQADEFDRLIESTGLRIGRFASFRDMDVWLLVLTNQTIISRRLSDYEFLSRATDQQLENYTLSATGIHWPTIDADLSLRGILMEEALKTLQIGGLLASVNVK